MVLGNAPFSGLVPGLRNIDLIVNGELLKRIVSEKIPTVKSISIAGEEEVSSAASYLSSTGLHKLRASVFNRKTPVRLDPDTIILPLEIRDREDLALLLTGLDTLMVQSVDGQWLSDIGAEIIEEFLALRSADLEPLTALYNVGRFNQFIAAQDVGEGDHLILVESLPPAQSVKDALTHVSKTARLLEEFNRFSFPLFHLGNSIFCFVINNREAAFVKSICSALTTFARNGGLRKIRAGFSSYHRKRHEKLSVDQVNTVLLDEAWEALQKAGRRGPYAFCDYELLVNPGKFPLSPSSSSSVGKIAYRVQGSDRFSLVYFKPDSVKDEHLDTIIKDCLADETVVFDPEGYFVVKHGQSAKVAKKWALSIIENVLSDHGTRCSMSAGISSYPFLDYKKSETIKNCQKALLHGSFFGPASAVIFDALSLNVSGDAYFSESDLSGAAREYRRGLELNPEDVNLLNSLGVTYALMNRTTKAQDIFDQVLAIDPENFMARFNKGLGEKKLERFQEAVASFSKALKHFDSDVDEERGVIHDLRYQLGLCLYHTGDYNQSIQVLKKYYETNKKQPGHERCFSFIGKSYYYLHKYKLAASWLQLGLNVNQFDAESLSLLGMIYLKTGEGIDIALRLCEKSVEIEPASLQFQVRYAQALEACGEVKNAAEIYSSCVRSKKTRAAAWLGMARLHMCEGESSGVDRYLKKISSLSDIDSDLLGELADIKDNLNKKK